MYLLKDLLTEQDHLQEEIAEIEESIKSRIDPLQVELQAIKEQINERISPEAVKAFQAAKKDTGTLYFIFEGVKIKAVIDKKVDWDQKELIAIWNRISSTGDNPEEYITRKETYTVLEKAFTAWPEQIRSVFLPARTLTPKSPRYECAVIYSSDDIPF